MLRYALLLLMKIETKMYREKDKILSIITDNKSGYFDVKDIRMISMHTSWGEIRITDNSGKDYSFSNYTKRNIYEIFEELQSNLHLLKTGMIDEYLLDMKKKVEIIDDYDDEEEDDNYDESYYYG